MCPTLKAQCAETGGKCTIDESEAVQCECPQNTNYVKDKGCEGKIIKYIFIFYIAYCQIFVTRMIRKKFNLHANHYINKVRNIFKWHSE